MGTTATLAVTAVGITPLSYQWQVDGMTLTNGGGISGVTGNLLVISNAQTNNTGSYTVVVTNRVGSVTSSNAVLTVTNIPPTISLQPTNQLVALGSNATLVVTATGTPPLSYQWQLDETNLLDGATNQLLTITNLQTTDLGSYSVTVTGPGGTVTSSNAVLTVLLPSPSFGSILATEGGGFILSGTGGQANGTYYVLSSSNLVAPLTSWTSIATDQFDSVGNFIFTNTAQTNSPQEFYILKLP